jgi:ribose transport system substrate-binding protein
MKMRDKGPAHERLLIALCALLVGVGVLVAGCGGNGTDSTSSEAAGKQKTEGENLAWEKINTGEFTAPKKSGNEYTADLGAGQSVHWPVGAQPNIAFFEQGVSNAYLQANARGAKEAAEAAGVKLTAFDANFEGKTQRSQIQNAIASGKFDAAVVLPIESQGSCNQLTKELPEANLPTVVIAQQTCGRDDKTGSELWSPGTVSWVGNDWIPYFAEWGEYLSEQFTSPTEVIFVGGPEELTVATVAEEAMKNVAAENPNFELAATVRTDYTTGQAFTDTQNLLQAHPGVKAVVLMYGGQLPGVISALKQAGKAGEVKVYDGNGGSELEKAAIEKGELVSTEGQYPYTSSYCAVNMLVAMFEGQKVPRVVPNECHLGDLPPDEQHATTYNKKNISTLHPVY